MDDSGSEPATRRLVLNPTSGRGEHVPRVRDLAADHGFEVVETEHPGHAAELARAAVRDGVDELAVCGGDGTLHEVVVGLYDCDGLEAVTLSVVPAGTENFVAGDLGLDSMAAGFEVATSGAVRSVDLGLVGDEPFVLSAITGLPADASAAATHDLKREFGPLAFVVGSVREGLAFDGLRVEVDAHTPDGEVDWRGDVMAVLVGNLRRFAGAGGQADAEDGLLEVAIVEEMPTGRALVEAIEQRLLGESTPHVVTMRARGLSVATAGEGPVTYSLDGEVYQFGSVDVSTLPGALSLRVGPDYEPHPDSESSGQG